MKTTLFASILSAAALSAALFAAPASAQTCGCQHYAPPAPPVVYSQPPVDDYYYGGDDYSYGYDNTQVIVEYPFGYWGGGVWRGHYFARGWYNDRRGYDRGYSRGYDRGYDRAYHGGGERFYNHQGGGYGHVGGGRGHR